VNYLWELGGRAILAIVGSSLLFGAIMGYAIAAWGNLPRPLGTALGAIFSFPGALGLWIAVLVRRSNARSRELATFPVGAPAESSFGFDAADTGYAGFGSYDAPSASFGSAADSGSGFGGSDFGGSGFGGFDEPVYTAPALIAAPAERRLDLSWARSRTGIGTVGTLLVAGIVLAVTFMFPWFHADSSLFPRVRIYAAGAGIDIALYVTLAIVAICAIITIYRPYRWVAVTVAWLSGTWLVATLVLLSARQAVTEFLTEIGAFQFSINDLVTALGADGEDVGVWAPVDLDSVDLAAAIPDIHLDLGSSWYIVLGFVVLAHVAVFFVLASADRRQKSIAAASAA